MKSVRLPLLILLGFGLAGWLGGRLYFHWGRSVIPPPATARPAVTAESADSFQEKVAGVLDVAALQAQWRLIEAGDREDWAWQIKAAALWQRWTELDAASAMAALPPPVIGIRQLSEMERMFESQPTEPKVLDDLPRMVVFSVLARKDLDSALKLAQSLPADPRIAAMNGILEVLAVDNAPRFFEIAATLDSKSIPEQFGIEAFWTVLKSDLPSALDLLQKNAVNFGKYGSSGMNAWELLLNTWKEKDPQALADWWLSTKTTVGINRYFESDLANRLALQFSSTNPTLAVEILIKKGGHSLWKIGSESLSLAVQLSQQVPGKFGNSALTRAIEAVQPRDLPLAAEWVQSLASQTEKNTAIQTLFPHWHDQAPAAALAWLLQQSDQETKQSSLVRILKRQPGVRNQMSFEQVDQALLSLPDELRNAVACRLLVDHNVDRTIERDLQMLEQMVPGPVQNDALAQLMSIWRKENPVVAGEFPKLVAEPALQTQFRAQAVAEEYLAQPDLAASNFKSLPAGGRRDAVAASMSVLYEAEEPGAAMEWAMQISDHTFRLEKLTQIARNCPAQKYPDVAKYFKDPRVGLSDLEVEQLRRVSR